MTTCNALYTADYQRKYLNEVELERFLIMAHEAGDADPYTQTLCEMLVYTGARISEVLALTSDHLDVRTGLVRIHSLKKRGRVHIREVYLPPRVMQLLNRVHLVERQQLYDQSSRLWPFSRYTAWRKVKQVMMAARIFGPQATCHGLRHTFGVNAVRKGIALNMLQRWMGHASISTTAMYARVTGPDERTLMARLWFEGDDHTTPTPPTSPPIPAIPPMFRQKHPSPPKPVSAKVVTLPTIHFTSFADLSPPENEAGTVIWLRDYS